MHSSSHAPILSSTRIRVLPCAAVEVPTTSSGGKAMAGGGGMAEEAESKEPLRSVLTRVLEKASWREVDGIWSPPSDGVGDTRPTDWSALSEDLLAILPSIDYCFEHTVRVSFHGFDWMHTSMDDRKSLKQGTSGKFYGPLNKSDGKYSALVETLQSKDPKELAAAAAAALKDVSKWVPSIKIEGSLTLWARNYDDHPLVQLLRERRQKGIFPVVTSNCCPTKPEPPQPLEDLPCGSVSSLVSKWRAEIEKGPLFPPSLKSVSTRSKASVAPGGSGLAKFDEKARKWQTQLAGQLGFTLTDEWRYLVTDKNKKHFNVEWDESRGRFALVVDLKHMEAMGGEPNREKAYLDTKKVYTPYVEELDMYVDRENPEGSDQTLMSEKMKQEANEAIMT